MQSFNCTEWAFQHNLTDSVPLKQTPFYMYVWIPTPPPPQKKGGGGYKRKCSCLFVHVHVHHISLFLSQQSLSTLMHGNIPLDPLWLYPVWEGLVRKKKLQKNDIPENTSNVSVPLAACLQVDCFCSCQTYDVCNLTLQAKINEVRAQKSTLKKIEDLGAKMEERLILDNRWVMPTPSPLLIQFFN